VCKARKEKELTPWRVHQLLAPALNLCRAIELEIVGHPGCPYLDTARKGTNGIIELLEILNGPRGAAEKNPDRQ